MTRLDLIKLLERCRAMTGGCDGCDQEDEPECLGRMSRAMQDELLRILREDDARETLLVQAADKAADEVEALKTDLGKTRLELVNAAREVLDLRAAMKNRETVTESPRMMVGPLELGWITGMAMASKIHKAAFEQEGDFWTLTVEGET